MRRCERCGGEVSWTHDTIVLPGHIYVHICHPCHRTFILMFRQTAVAMASADLEAREDHYSDLATAGEPVSEGVRRELMRDQRELLVELAEMSVAWLAERVEKPVKQVTPTY